MTLALGNGQPDSYFVSEVRRIFRDQPTWQNEAPASDGVSGAISSATSKPMHTQRSPVARNQAFLTAPSAGGTQPGFTAYKAIFDPPLPIPNPTVAPVISDAGAGGTWLSGAYRFLYTYSNAVGVEFGMSPLSNLLAIPVNHQVTFGALTGIPTGVTQVNVYIVSSTANGIGLEGTIAVAAGATVATTFPNANGNTILPAMIVSDTGEVFFPLAPAAGTVNLSYQTSRYSDQQVLDALYEGLGMLWPEIWSYQPYDMTSVLPSPVQYEYALPVVPYSDPRTLITQVETRPPQAWVRFRRISGWRFNQDPLTPTLIFERTPPAGGQVRITAVQPFQNLADIPGMGGTGILLPPANLPVYYAVGRLLADAEVMRSRADDLPALTGENAGSEKGGNLQTATFWFSTMFAEELKKLSIGKPARRMIAHRIVERLNLSSIWQEAA
jgi:hypothetical protein